MKRLSFGENLTRLIKAHQMTNAELARRIGVSAASITRYCQNERMPDGPELVAMAKVFSIEPVDLLGSAYREPLPAGPPPPRGRPRRKSDAPPEHESARVPIHPRRRRTG